MMCACYCKEQTRLSEDLLLRVTRSETNGKVLDDLIFPAPFKMASRSLARVVQANRWHGARALQAYAAATPSVPYNNPDNLARRFPRIWKCEGHDSSFPLRFADAQRCSKQRLETGHLARRRGMCFAAGSAKVCGEEWPEHDFVQVAEGSLELISEQVSQIGYDSKNAPADFDTELSQGVLTISVGSFGTYVINTQTPNRQIWLSSPASGPWRYAWSPHEKSWVSTRDGHPLASRLTQELSDVFKESVQISFSQVSTDE